MARFVKEVGRNYNQFVPEAGPGSGTVTSVALTAPTGFTVTGSPITSSGTLALSFTTGYGIPPLMTGNSGKFLTTNGTTMSWVNIAGTDVTGAALTEVDDTNVTMTLGGTPSTALLRSVSMTLGWAGQLAVSRGGTGAATLTGVIIGNGTSAMTAVTGGPLQLLRVNAGATGYEFFAPTYLINPMTTSGDIIYGAGAGTPTRLAANGTANNMFLRSVSSGIPSWSTIAGSDITGSALTETDDTNVTLTLGGTPSTALLRSVSMTLGWTGTLSVSRGGSGAATLTGVLIGNGTSAFTAITGGPNQILRVNGTATGYEFYTASFLTNPMTLNFDMIYQSGGVPARLPGNITTTKQYLTSIGNGSATTSLGWASFTNSDVPGDALTKVDDTNVTLTLGGTPSTAVLRATSLTLGWSGTLAVGRGGTGASTLTGVLIGNGTSAVTAVVGTAGQFLRRNLANTAYEFRTLQGGDIAGSELTFSNDTNVTMSLSGTPASALLQPVTIGLGWTGTLSVARGGIGVGTITGVMIGNGTSAVTGVTGTANQILRRNAGNTAYEFWSANYMTNPMTLEGSIIYATTGGTPAELFANSTSTRKYLSQINGGAPSWEALSFPTGSGTTNYVAKWSSSTVLTNSQIIDDGTNVGVGISPLYKLDVNGAIGLFNTILAFRTGGYTLLYDESSVVTMRFGDSSNQVNNYENTTHYIKNRGGGVTFATINSTGLGIGISPTYKLDVNGTIGISGTQFAYRSGNYHVIFDAQGSDALTLGNASAPVNAYDNTSHLFRSRGGGTNFTTIASSGIVINAGNLQLSSAYNITWGGVYGTDIPTISGTSGGGTNGFLQFYPAGSTSGVKMALARTGQLYLGAYTSSTSFTGTAVATLAVNNTGDVITLASAGVTASGTYTPTWTGLLNVDSTTAYSCQYMRVGNTVTVSGYLNINATVDNDLTRVRFTLPINASVTGVNYLNGTAAAEGGFPTGCIYGSTTDSGILEVTPPVDTGINYSFHFTYRLA